MKRLLKSALIILGFAAIAGYATYSFFNDTETSTGNTFTAGAIDLKVDHTLQTYNGVDCKTCDVAIKSDTTNEVTAQVGGIDPGPFPHPAVLVTNINPAWTANVPGASWIWWTDPTPEAEKGVDTTYTFRKTFIWMGPLSGATLSLATAADNGYEVWLNGVNIGSDPGEQNYNAAGQDLYTGFAAQVLQGTNTLEIKVKNMLRPVGQTWDNPGGLLYQLVIDGNCDDDYFMNHCTLFGEKDLVPGDQFWNFDDVKPGDHGTNVISLHPYSNDAYVCMRADNVVNEEHGLVDPEIALSDTDSTGELHKYLNLFVWDDMDGDGVYEPTGETVLYSGNFDGLNGGINRLAIPGNGSGNLGVSWCVGSQTVDHTSGAISCDGTGAHNDAQTDQLIADLVFYAEQQRNNSGFSCPQIPN